MVPPKIKVCETGFWLGSGGRHVRPMSSAAPKKKTFDRGGPAWPPRSNAADDRLGGVCGGQGPPAKIRGEMDFFSKIFEKNFEQKSISPLIFWIFNRKSRR